MNVGAFGLLRMNAGEPGCARARMIARAISQRFAIVMSEAGEDQQTIAERLEGFQCGSELEARAFRGGRPVLHDDAVGCVKERGPPDRRGRRLSAGTMESSSGRATAAPMPRNMVRRERAFIRSPPHLKWYAIHDSEDNRGKTVVVVRCLAADGAHRGLVVRFEAPAQSVCQHLRGTGTRRTRRAGRERLSSSPPAHSIAVPSGSAPDASICRAAFLGSESPDGIVLFERKPSGSSLRMAGSTGAVGAMFFQLLAQASGGVRRAIGQRRNVRAAAEAAERPGCFRESICRAARETCASDKT